MNEPYVIGVDVGTGSTKAVAVLADNKPIATAQLHYETIVSQAGWSEQDPQEIWEAFVDVIRSVCEEMGYPPACVSLSSCMHSLLLLDGSNQPLTPLITWADNRAAAIAESLRTSDEGKSIYNATGTPLHAMSPLCKVIWFKENEPEVFNRTAKFISIKEFLWWRLFGEFEIDYSIASATGLFDVTGKQWHEESLRIAGINASKLSMLRRTSFIRNNINPDVADGFGLPSSIRFCIGASDGCLANLGSGALGGGVAAVTIGTSGAVRIASNKPLPSFPAMPFSYVLDDDWYVCGGPVSNGGNVLQWIRKTFFNDGLHYHDLLAQLNSIPAGSDGLLCLPFLYGERSPVWDEKASGTFIGIRSHHTKLHFAKAALEGVCFALRSVMEELEKSGAVHRLHVSGGISESEVWLQTLANVTSKKVAVVQVEDASAVGAAMMGFKAMGLAAPYDVNRAASASFHPEEKATDLYNNYFAAYRRLYPSIQSVMHSL